MAPADDNDYFSRRNRNTQAYKKTQDRGILEEDHCLRIAGPVSPKVTHSSGSEGRRCQGQIVAHINIRRSSERSWIRRVIRVIRLVSRLRSIFASFDQPMSIDRASQDKPKRRRAREVEMGTAPGPLGIK